MQAPGGPYHKADLVISFAIGSGVCSGHFPPGDFTYPNPYFHLGDLVEKSQKIVLSKRGKREADIIIGIFLVMIGLLALYVLHGGYVAISSGEPIFLRTTALMH